MLLIKRSLTRCDLTVGRQLSWTDLLRGFFRGDEGQDLVEYALITAFIGIVGYLVLRAIGVEVFNTYSSWLSPASGVPSRWDPPEPSGS